MLYSLQIASRYLDILTGEAWVFDAMAYKIASRYLDIPTGEAMGI